MSHGVKSNNLFHTKNKLYSSEESTLSFTDNADTSCDYSISTHTPDKENINDTHTSFMPKYPAVHTHTVS